MKATKVTATILYLFSALFFIVFLQTQNLMWFNAISACVLALLGYGVQKKNRIATTLLIIIGGLYIAHSIAYRFVGIQGDYLLDFIIGLCVILFANWADREIINNKEQTSPQETKIVEKETTTNEQSIKPFTEIQKTLIILFLALLFSLIIFLI